MPKDTQKPDLVGLELVQRLVADHGDALRFSLSKKGRIWLTLTHWDTEKYNTSVELDSFSEVTDTLDAMCVLGVAHYAKCFGAIAHADSWNGVAATRDLVPDARAMCHEYLSRGDNNVDHKSPEESETQNQRVADSTTP